MSLEALQQSIIQRPNMVLAGISSAEEQAKAEQLFAMAKQDRLVQGILQAMGLYGQQQQFGAQFDEQKRATGVQEGFQANADLRAGYADSRDQAAADRDKYRFEGTEGRPEWQQNQRQMQLEQLEGYGIQNEGGRLGNIGQEQQNAYGQRTMDARVGLANTQAEAAQQDLAQSRLMDPLAYDNAVQQFNINEQQRNWAIEDRPSQVQSRDLGVRSQQFGVDAQKARSDFENKFRGAKTDAERHEVIGGNPEVWAQFQLQRMEGENRLRVAGAKDHVDPSEYVLGELNKLTAWAKKTTTTNVSEMVQLTPDAAMKSASALKRLQDVSAAINDGTLSPEPGESAQGFYGRVLSTLELDASALKALLEMSSGGESAAQQDSAGGSKAVAPGSPVKTPPR